MFYCTPHFLWFSIHFGEFMSFPNERKCMAAKSGKQCHAEARATLIYGIRKSETGIRNPESANKRPFLQIYKSYVDKWIKSMNLNVNWSTWHERRTEKTWVPTGIEPITFQTPGGRSIHWATRTHGDQSHLTEFRYRCLRIRNPGRLPFDQKFRGEFPEISVGKWYSLFPMHGRR